MVTTMRLNRPGLLREKMRSGAIRWRVRVAGNKTKRILLNLTPDHPQFSEHYHAARQGIQLEAPISAEDAAIKSSIGWLVAKYQTHLDQQLSAGQLKKDTVRYRKNHTNTLRNHYGEYAIGIPTGKLIELRDTMADKPSSADTFVKSMSALYTWACDRGHALANPATGIKRIAPKSKGARAWTVDDLQKYRKTHKDGSMAHLYLTLLMFTACRIGDAVALGRTNEFKKNGNVWLKWDTEKSNAPEMNIPMAAPLYRATRAQIVQGPTYILNAYGQPFASKDALSNRFSKWIAQAGLEGLSSHGVRKAAGSLMAEAGVSQHAIMAIHGHTEAKTSEIYTRAAERETLAKVGMEALEKMAW